MQLPLHIRVKLIRQDILSALGLGGNVPVALAERDGGLVVQVDGREFYVASPLRWKLYKKGWNGRLDQLEREYGVGRHVKLGPDSLVLDIGANAGEFAHICARYGATVHCFEPDPKVNACLRRNIAQLNNATAHDIVIYKEDGEVSFGLAPDRADSSVIFGDKVPVVKKKAQTVASFCRENGIAHVDFIKCDAEGAEPEVLEGIGDFFPNISALALDTGPERMGERTNKECAAILAANGFTVIDEKVGKRCMTYGVRK